MVIVSLLCLYIILLLMLWKRIQYSLESHLNTMYQKLYMVIFMENTDSTILYWVNIEEETIHWYLVTI